MHFDRGSVPDVDAHHHPGEVAATAGAAHREHVGAHPRSPSCEGQDAPHLVRHVDVAFLRELDSGLVIRELHQVSCGRAPPSPSRLPTRCRLVETTTGVVLEAVLPVTNWVSCRKRSRAADDELGVLLPGAVGGERRLASRGRPQQWSWPEVDLPDLHAAVRLRPT